MEKGIISRNIGLLMEHFNIRNESQLAKQVGMPQTTINKLVSGVSADPRISTLTPIIEHFHISLDTLLNENPIFGRPKENQPLDILIPIISYDEAIDMYENLSSLNTSNWPNWFPIPHQKDKKYYAIHLTLQELSQPFDRTSVLVIKNNSTLQDNTYCIIRHIESNSINIKKVSFENGKKWLIALQPKIPAAEYNKQQWTSLGTIQAAITDLTDHNFISIGN